MKTLLLLLAAQVAFAQGIDWATQLKNRPDILKVGNDVSVGSVGGGNLTVGVACVAGVPPGSVCVRGTYYGDGSGLTGVSGGGGGAGSALTTVVFSTTPTFAVSTSAIQVFRITLTGNIASATLSTTLATVGQVIAWEYCQDGTGGRTVVWPTNVFSYGAVDTTASACSTQGFVWDGTNAIALGGMVSSAATPGLVTSAGLLALPTAPDTLAGIATSQVLTNKTIDTASNTVKIAGTTVTGKQGTAAVVQMAGTVSGAGASLCTDANGNTTTSGCVSGAPTAGTQIGVSGTAVSYNPFDTTAATLFDEPFCTGGNSNGAASAVAVGREGWIANLTNAGTQLAIARSTATDKNHICGIAVKAPASISNGEVLILAVNGSAALIQSDVFTAGGFRPFEMQWQAKLSATTNIRFQLAFAASASMQGSSANGCGIKYDTTTSDANWIAFCGDASTWTTATVVGTVDTNIHRFRIWQTAQGTVNFSVDGGTTTAITTKIPTSSSTPLIVSMQINNDGTSTTSQMDLFRAVGRITGLSVN